MKTQTAAPQQDPKQPRQPASRPHLAAIVAHFRRQEDGGHLLEGERLCACNHLEGDHQIGGGQCSRCRRCPAFEVHPEDEVTAPLPLPLGVR